MARVSSLAARGERWRTQLLGVRWGAPRPLLVDAGNQEVAHDAPGSSTQLLPGTPSACISEPNGTVEGSFDQRFEALISIGECVSDDELTLLLKKKTVPICYVWCDPSPWMQLTQAMSMTINVNKMVKAGLKVKILMADWFAQMDPRFGGSISKMQTIGWYNIEMWKASGMDLDGVEFVQLSEEIGRHADLYWPVAMDIARQSNLSEIKKCFDFHASKDLRGCGTMDPYMMREPTPAEILFPCLQSAVMLFPEVFHISAAVYNPSTERPMDGTTEFNSHPISRELMVDLWLLSMDQHGANMLAREYCNLMQSKNTPIALFHYKAPDFLPYPEWEEWENVRWSIFMEDDEEDVSRKIDNALCPEKFAEGNPCSEYIKYIILPWFGKFEVLRKEENGGNIIFLSMEEFVADYESGALHPADVKQALVKAVNMLLQVVRDRFRSNAEPIKLAKAIEDLHLPEAFCSLSSLFVASSTLAIDLGLVWNGPWRWFDESMLDCCETLSKVKSEAFGKVVCLCIVSAQG
ncbi:tyrosine--tRNA ligase 1, cytoplasmic-like [Lolium rigidum]|uniref:tyrosine--tRNA ligase 1, cytoplasmic-like n=1 Tax=Lolium rigidum TaxID=89674 RepID=UPI001F5CEF12|nr:tyrosine--tRNA ligase 1, cytoplasmic-like [Lolium rigidum]